MQSGGGNTGYPISSTRAETTSQHQPGYVACTSHRLRWLWLLFPRELCGHHQCSRHLALIVAWHSPDLGDSAQPHLVLHSFSVWRTNITHRFNRPGPQHTGCSYFKELEQSPESFAFAHRRSPLLLFSRAFMITRPSADGWRKG